ncbi:MAG: glucosaminidase domain-containing protein [Saprospiraceae bacterium]|nr:glucosaminidase domain-containing protein [Saprospiraceae bacterium]MDW8230712.1 glucosaminidase domain-containing protein [Saprospiraceae bacterium]
MGRTKWQAASEDDFQQARYTSSRRRERRRAQAPGMAPAPVEEDFSPQEIAHMLGIRLQRLWVALKFRWYYAKSLFLQGGVALKIGVLGALGYFVLDARNDADLPVSSTGEGQPVVWRGEAVEENLPAVSQVEAPEPVRPDRPGGREVLLPDANRPGAPAPVAKTPTPPHSGSQEATDPAPVWVRDDDAEKVNRYVERFSNVAIQEMRKFGVPASIALAQGLIESRFGTSTLAVRNNNHFGIKCFSKNCRPGHCTNLEDDHHKDFFRKYATAWESWRAHSILISTGRYARLKKYGKNYRAWAKGLEELGYATDRNYSAKLIGVIERYNLHRFDH